jgi:hypothetical protein
MDPKSRNKVEEDRAGFSGPAEPNAPPAGGKEDWGDDWVHELIAMTRPGIEIEFPVREINEREVPFVYDDFR